MEKLKSNESILSGQFIFDGKVFNEDDVCKRINWLIDSYLKKIATDESGWETLFQDPEDNRYWELSFPHGEVHGGGEPQLKLIAYSEAKQKFKF